jgi:hypothetical protein
MRVKIQGLPHRLCLCLWLETAVNPFAALNGGTAMAKFKIKERLRLSLCVVPPEKRFLPDGPDALSKHHSNHCCCTRW